MQQEVQGEIILMALRYIESAHGKQAREEIDHIASFDTGSIEPGGYYPSQYVQLVHDHISNRYGKDELIKLGKYMFHYMTKGRSMVKFAPVPVVLKMMGRSFMRMNKGSNFNFSNGPKETSITISASRVPEDLVLIYTGSLKQMIQTMNKRGCISVAEHKPEADARVVFKIAWE